MAMLRKVVLAFAALVAFAGGASAQFGAAPSTAPAPPTLSTSAAPVIAFIGDSITYRGNLYTYVFTVGGTPEANDVLNLTATQSTLTNSPVTASYTIIAGDTTTTAALTATPSLAQLWIKMGFVSPLSTATVAGTFNFASPSCRKVQQATQ